MDDVITCRSLVCLDCYSVCVYVLVKAKKEYCLGQVIDMRTTKKSPL
jgi:hypothetical protein